ncbi:hypothetical protein RBG61_10570 [Paludicola sp. MB14-C6]|uniref:hypothetical protein n=1 Tax=Paludihabitans sp. MB14-C6 TaxID=3070656 RepID=UPI0027DB9D58|nr:hypothetical protein [Paludicola sp. MB14-C6]WMJ22426.1 hypothetical protein RBG61_10570 [Paludicola sp. MB14-C6]
MESTFNCPLIKNTIDEGLCYDVQMVRGKYIKPKALCFQLDIDLSNKLCSNCAFNQFPDHTE